MFGKKIMEVFGGEMVDFKNLLVDVGGMAVNCPALELDAGLFGQVFQRFDKTHAFVFL